MQIDEYEFEEEMTLTSLAELFSKLAEDVTEGQRLELRMPSLKSGVIELPSWRKRSSRLRTIFERWRPRKKPECLRLPLENKFFNRSFCAMSWSTRKEDYVRASTQTKKQPWRMTSIVST
jgi:hypothetical protein